MLFLASDLAIFRRLVGYPLDSSGLPKMDPVTGLPANRLLPKYPEKNRRPSYGVRIPVYKAPYDGSHQLSSKNANSVRLFEAGFEPFAFRQIPVFYEGLEGRKWEDIWPCVTFRLSDFDQRAENFVYHDPFEAGVGSDTSIVNKSGQVVGVGKPTIHSRPHPEMWNLEYTISVYSKSPIEFSLINEAIMGLFPQRSALEIEQMDGSIIANDFLLIRSQDSSQRRDQAVPLSLEGDQSAYYAHSFVYRLEGFLDNTRNRFGIADTTEHSTILVRVLEIADLQDKLIEDPVYLNALENELGELSWHVSPQVRRFEKCARVRSR